MEKAEALHVRVTFVPENEPRAFFEHQIDEPIPSGGARFDHGAAEGVVVLGGERLARSHRHQSGEGVALVREDRVGLHGDFPFARNPGLEFTVFPGRKAHGVLIGAGILQIEPGEGVAEENAPFQGPVLRIHELRRIVPVTGRKTALHGRFLMNALEDVAVFVDEQKRAASRHLPGLDDPLSFARVVEVKERLVDLRLRRVRHGLRHVDALLPLIEIESNQPRAAVKGERRRRERGLRRSAVCRRNEPRHVENAGRRRGLRPDDGRLGVGRIERLPRKAAGQVHRLGAPGDFEDRFAAYGEREIVFHFEKTGKVLVGPVPLMPDRSAHQTHLSDEAVRPEIVSEAHLATFARGDLKDALVLVRPVLRRAGDGKRQAVDHERVVRRRSVLARRTLGIEVEEPVERHDVRPHPFKVAHHQSGARPDPNLRGRKFCGFAGVDIALRNENRRTGGLLLVLRRHGVSEKEPGSRGRFRAALQFERPRSLERDGSADLRTVDYETALVPDAPGSREGLGVVAFHDEPRRLRFVVLHEPQRRGFASEKSVRKNALPALDRKFGSARDGRRRGRAVRIDSERNRPAEAASPSGARPKDVAPRRQNECAGSVGFGRYSRRRIVRFDERREGGVFVHPIDRRRARALVVPQNETSARSEHPKAFVARERRRGASHGDARAVGENEGVFAPARERKAPLRAERARPRERNRDGSVGVCAQGHRTARSAFQTKSLIAQ